MRAKFIPIHKPFFVSVNDIKKFSKFIFIAMGNNAGQQFTELISISSFLHRIK